MMMHTRLKSIPLLAAALSLSLLTACGGGAADKTANGSSEVPGTTVTVTPYKGAYTAGTVTVRDVSGNQIASAPISGALAAVRIPLGSAYPLTLYVTGTYYNEATGNPETSPANLRSVIPDSELNASGWAVTPLTEMAAAVLSKRVADGEALNAALVKTVTAMVASSVLNLSYEQAMTPPVFNVTTGKTADMSTFKLAALSLSANADGNGNTLAEKLVNVAGRIAAGEAPAAVLAHYGEALNAVTATSGISSQQQDSQNPVSVAPVVLASFPLVDTQPINANTLRWDGSGTWGVAAWR